MQQEEADKNNKSINKIFGDETIRFQEAIKYTIGIIETKIIQEAKGRGTMEDLINIKRRLKEIEGDYINKTQEKKTLSDKVGNVRTFPHHEVLMLADVKEFIRDILHKANRTQSIQEIYNYIRERAGEKLI